VTVALSERLERVKREDLAARKARIMALAADAASRIKEPYKSMTQKELIDQL